MTSSGPRQLVIVGTGNVAWHLGHALLHSGITISQVLARSVSDAQRLGSELQAIYSGRPEDLDSDADACLICVSEEAISQVLKKMKPEKCLLIHTSGSMPMDMFSGFAINFGVLYPLQTLTKGFPVNYSGLPLLIEANTQDNLLLIKKIADKISGRVLQVDSKQRLYLHLAAVFANNFTNHMFALAEKLSLEHGFSFELLKPLMEETVAKAISLSPREAQTGPAIRKNSRIIEKHLALLMEHPDLQQLYRLISESIRMTRKEQGAGAGNH